MIGTIARTTTVFAAVALVAAASLPAAAANDPNAKTSETKPVKERRYCVEQVTTGTMLRAPKVCKTREEWIAKTGIDPAGKKN
ncbi:hypothetical protein [Sphingomonas sp. dw_22]|uniref:hypothetical protein n=1 Tax=Sphingomonas sp. dw_22 TaxID=2721175 RepID=UPI001BD1CF5C|nr:hypothetical protein [Sphingomonas sp. dw_22]